ncbi:MAG: ribosome-associated translation inhibitor RaiA [Bacteroidia bacterium]|nr:HPF/RaiA family ribosome-associated protein [Bacteroidales bacterium]MDY0286199.1 HPF/RaiA family ribosome-associated protein [Bacteroidales bacterium]NCD41004.1 ribosome-associated translation inhibitor RaiA [Bacteroidia bacterium]HPE86667.1 HPF/RaiA family ribosome-associated protein [Bacteroidales bacterium]
MNISINSVGFKADQKLEEFIERKVTKIGSLYDGVIGSEVTLKIDAKERPDNKIAEIRLLVPGEDLFVKKQTDSFEESADSACGALKKQLVKHKDRMRGK